MKTGATASESQPSPRGEGSVRGSEAQRLATRWWRRWTLLYFILLTIGTHWPQLTIGTGTGPPPDKILHLFAFGGLTLLLWQCRVIKNIWLVAIIVIAWLVIDEITQSLPILHRESSWMDVASGITGVACAIAWILATAPLKGKLSQLRRQQFEQVVNQKLSNFWGWLLVGLRALFWGVFAMVLSVVFASFLSDPQVLPKLIDVKDPFITAIVAFCLAVVFCIIATFILWSRRRTKGDQSLSSKFDARLIGWFWGLCIICVTIVGGVFSVSFTSDLSYPPEPLKTVANLASVLMVAAFLTRCARLHLRWASLLGSPSTVCGKCGHVFGLLAERDQSLTCPACHTVIPPLHNEATTGR